MNYQEYHPFRKDLHFKTALLRSGEKILFCVERDLLHTDKHSMKIIEPVVIEIMQYQRSDGVIEHGSRIKPWMNLSESDDFVIPTEFIIAMGDMRPDVREHYVEYVENLAKAKAEVRHRREYITDEEHVRMNNSMIEMLQEVNKGTPVRFVDE